MNVYTQQILLPMYQQATFNGFSKKQLIKTAWSWPWKLNLPWNEPASKADGAPSTSSTVPETVASANAPAASGIDMEDLKKFMEERFGRPAPVAERRVVAPRRIGRSGGIRIKMPGIDMRVGGGRRRRVRPVEYVTEAAPVAAAPSYDDFYRALSDYFDAHPIATPTPTPTPSTTPTSVDTAPAPKPELKYSEEDLAREKAKIDAAAANSTAWKDKADARINRSIADRDANRRAWKRYRNLAPIVSFGGAALGGTLASKLYDKITGKKFKDRTWGDWWLRTGLTGLGGLAGFAGGAYLNNRFLKPKDIREAPIM